MAIFAAAVAGAIVMLSLSMGPGPRNSFLVAATRLDVKAGRKVLLGYTVADSIFAVLAVVASAVISHWPTVVAACVFTSICLLLTLTARDVQALLGQRVNVLPPSTRGSFSKACRQSLANPGLAFDAVIPVGAIAALLGDELFVAEGFVIGSLLGAMGWMSFLHLMAARSRSALPLDRSWSCMLVAKIILTTAIVTILATT